MFVLDPKSTTPLVTQIVTGFRQMVDDGSLRAGAKAPSIRQFAHAHGVSVYTVVDAYDRLVALGMKGTPGDDTCCARHNHGAGARGFREARRQGYILPIGRPVAVRCAGDEAGGADDRIPQPRARASGAAADLQQCQQHAHPHAECSQDIGDRRALQPPEITTATKGCSIAPENLSGIVLNHYPVELVLLRDAFKSDTQSSV